MQTIYKKIIDNFLNNCERYAAKTALVYDEKTLTYRDLLNRILQWEKLFLTNNIKSGDRVLLITSHRRDFISAWMALWKINAVAIPLEPSVAPDELGRSINVSLAHWIITENSEHKKGIPANTRFFNNDIQPDWIIGQLVPEKNVNSIPDSSFYIYTSGTTGTPKCVMYDHDTAMAIINSLILAYQLTDKDVILTPLTPALSATLITGILPGLLSGATLILPSEPIPGKVLKLIKTHQVTIFFAVPYFYNLLIEAMKIRQNASWESVRLCLSTSAFLPGVIFDGFYELTQLPIRSIFCTSEANQCSFNPSEEIDRLKNSVGLPQSGVLIKIVDQQDNETKPGEEGQIIVSGTHLSKGYFCRPDLETKVYKNGWVYTGDLGLMDENGYLYITGRLSDTINVSGHLVNPQEVESVLITHEGVKEALVLGEGDNQVGEQVIGWVVLEKGKPVTTPDLIEYCKKRLIHYKVPSKINFTDELPKSRYGKIKRLTPITNQQ